MCGFVQDKTDQFDWRRHKGSTSSFYTGPSADHSGDGGWLVTTCQLQQDTTKAISLATLHKETIERFTGFLITVSFLRRQIVKALIEKFITFCSAQFSSIQFIQSQ